MVQVIDTGGTLATNLGAGFGRGLAEQVPKEIERTRLASGLEKLAGSTEQNPLRQLASLYNIPGITPQIASQAQEYLRQQAIINEANRANQPVKEGEIPSAAQPSAIPATAKEIRPPQRLQSTPEAIRQGGLQYIARFPQRYRNIEEAENRYRQDVANQEKQIAHVDNRFTEVGDELLQKFGPERYTNVLGELQREFKKRAEDAVLSGQMSETEAADHYTKQMLDFAKARDKQQTQGPERFKALFAGTPQKELKAAQKAYQEADLPEAFVNDLVTYQKLSLPVASEFAFPLDPEEKKYFKDLKVSKGVFGNTQKVYEEVLNRLSPKDSLQNFALQLSKKGYSPQQFLEYALNSEKKFTPFQTRELQSIGSFQPTLSDILYFKLLGKGG